MKLRPLLPLFLLPSGLLWAADPIALESRVTEATVYADRAEVTRSARADLPVGLTTVRFEDLPPSVFPNSLRLSGEGDFTLLDLQFRPVTREAVSSGEAAALEEAIADLEDEMELLQANKERLANSRSFVGAVGKRFTTPAEGEPVPTMDPGSWRGILAFQEEELARLAEEEVENRNALEAANEAAKRLRKELAQLGAASRKTVYVAEARLECATAGTVGLRLSYQVGHASWRPAYDLRVGSEPEAIEVIYHGMVRQNTGEDWEGVKLFLSTASPQLPGRPPELSPWYLRVFQPMARKNRAMDESAPMDDLFAGAGLDVREASAAMPEPQAARQPVATVRTGLVSVVFGVEVASDVPADGREVQVPITREKLEPEFSRFAVPKASPHVYLRAETTNRTDFPLLPGAAMVFLDNSFVAETELDFVAAGESFEIFLGTDPGVTVERELVERLRESTGFTGKRERVTFDYRFRIANNRRTPIRLELTDQVPQPTDEEIKVELEDPKPDGEWVTRSEEGFLTWKLVLDPGESIERHLVFRVEYPKDMTVDGLPPAGR